MGNITENASKGDFKGDKTMKKEINRLYKRKDTMMNIISRLSDEKIEKIQNEMLDNAYHLIKDAKLLIKQNKSFGHGFGLIALACEEIAKVYMLSLEKNQKNRKDPFRNHTEKQQSLAALTFAQYIPIYLKITFEKRCDGETIEDEDNFEKIFNENLQDFVERIQNDPELKKRMLQRQYFFGRLEVNKQGESIYKTGYLSEMKEYSLYVDIISDTDYFTPKSILEDNTLILTKIAEEDLYYTDLIYNKSKIIRKYKIKKPNLPLDETYNTDTS